MIGNLYSAFALTVFCCLAPIMIVSLVVPFVMQHMEKRATKNKKNKGVVRGVVTYVRLYVTALVVLSVVAIIGWFAFLTVGGRDSVESFVESLPIDQAILDSVNDALAEPETVTE